MRSPGGSGAMGGGEIHPINQPSHAELVSASIVPPAQVLQNHAAGAVCAFDASAKADGWTLKQVQGDDDFEIGA